MKQLEALQQAADAARAALAAYDSQRRWGEHAALLDMCCVQSSGSANSAVGQVRRPAWVL